MRFLRGVVSLPREPFIANVGAVAIDPLMAGTGVVGIDVARYTQSYLQDFPLFGMVLIFVFHQDAVQLSR